VRTVLFIALMTAGLARGDDIAYGTQLYGQGAFIANKDAPGRMAVGVQANGWAQPKGKTPGEYTWTFGLAAEAVGWAGSDGILIGIENMVGNAEPTNFSRKVANNAVMRCAVQIPCASPNNYDSIAYWVSADRGTGFGSALKLDRNSIADYPGHHATVIDLSDLDPARNAEVVFVKLPGGEEVTIEQFIRALRKL
jgi:hypothetical protein